MNSQITGLPGMLEAVTTFQRDGAAMLHNVISGEWLSRLAAAFDELLPTAHDLSAYYSDDKSAKASPLTGRNLSSGENWLASDDFREFVFTSPLPEIAAAMIGAREVRLFEDLLVYKCAGAQQPTPWHQDSPQNPLDGVQQCSIWFSLDRVTRDTGSLRFVAGSQKGPMYIPYLPASQRDRLEADMPFFSGGPLPDVEAHSQDYVIKSWDLDPGDILIFHPQSLHGAYGSAPAIPRRSLSIRFFGEDVRWEPKATMFHSWLRDVALDRGDHVRGTYFPQLWPPIPGEASQPRPARKG